MLKKLLKHEFYATYRVYIPVILAIIGFTALIDIAGIIVVHYSNNDAGKDIIGLFVMAVIGIVFLIVFFAFISPYIFSSIRFYKTMATNEAYLTFSIPAKTESIVITKVIIATMWALVVTVVMIAAIISFVFCVATPDVEADIYKGVYYLFQKMESVNYCVMYIISTIVSVASLLMNILLSIAIGQLAKSHRVWASIGIYIAINFVESIIATVISMPFSFRMAVDSGMSGGMPPSLLGMYNMGIVMLLVTIVEKIVLFVAAYLITCYIFKKKLNVM